MLRAVHKTTRNELYNEFNSRNIIQYLRRIQGSLFSFLEEELVAILELVRIEPLIPNAQEREGSPPKARSAIARSFAEFALKESSQGVDIF